MKPLKTWALIADGARARILENNGSVHGTFLRGDPLHEPMSHDWMPVEGLVFRGDHEATHDIVEDRQGRSFSSIGHGRSAIEPHTDPHRHLKSKFAVHLAQFLAEALQENRFYRLIIAAPPVTLGDLRSAISPQVQATVIAEFAHDLTKIPNHEIGSHLLPVKVG